MPPWYSNEKAAFIVSLRFYPSRFGETKVCFDFEKQIMSMEG